MFTFTGIVKGQVETSTFWPTINWNITDPADQGMSNSTFYEMYGYIGDKSLNIRSVSIVRNGFLIHEEYLYDCELRSGINYGPGHPPNQVINETLHVQWSATKTIIALLIGIAIDNGYISNVSQTFSSFFPTLIYSTQDKEDITIKHLLTMTSGIPDEGRVMDPGVTYNKTIQEILNPDLLFTPGTDWDYSSFSTNLLSAIINKTTGQKTSEFAQNNLFEPIGISREDWYWEENIEGYNHGGFGLWFTPQAMSRIGLLMLNNGNWNNTQVISENWIIEMGTIRSPQCSYGVYGYLVWINQYAFNAAGLGGQYIYFIPTHNLVVTFTGMIFPADPAIDYLYIIDNFIIGAIDGPPSISGYLFLILLLVLLPSILLSVGFFFKKNNKKIQV